MAKIAILGFGTVGSGVYEVLCRNAAGVSRRAGEPVEVKYILDPKDFSAHPAANLFIKNFDTILEDPEIRVVVETIGGTRFAYPYVKACLESGRSVCTSNKEMVATYGAELLALAKAHNCAFLFEASVGGGTPIITPMHQCLAANVITEVEGIVNGTTNYMLTRMGEDGLSYDEALAEAQAKGFAEADPTADVDGHDAAAKIAILASIAFNSRVVMDDVYTEGIRRISPVDLAMADTMGYAVKLVAHAHRTDHGIDVRVHPTMIPLDHQLAKVNGVYNAIYVIGDAVGETMFFGEGAGAGPAASAVMGDVLEVARHLQLGVKPIVGCTCTDNIPVISVEELQTKYYLRFLVEDRAGVLAACADIFAKYDVSLQSVQQRGTKARDAVNLVFVTHTAHEDSVAKVIDEILALPNAVIGGYPSVIRVQD